MLLLLWIISLQLVGFALGMITQANLDPWYLNLVKSSVTPPGYVFGITWVILYFLHAITAWLLFHKLELDKPAALRALFLTQLVLNWLWTPLFFYYHWIGTALVCLIAIVILTTIFIINAKRQSQALFGLMLPYWGWVVFAAYLNLTIWLNN